ncbi:hypothetical protein TNCV_1572141 [Trichonephila clavipes]|uniref:Uncharacterized protein n=1 Tax=Trichonephila clavipes TaxID=2585209 RepID=A0A8X6SPU5_TRICX|nr:hypothetical protein TNCV_1572141 [Trichonephila clavipes]
MSRYQEFAEAVVFRCLSGEIHPFGCCVETQRTAETLLERQEVPLQDVHWCAKLKQQCKNLADSHEIAEKEVWRSVQ